MVPLIALLVLLLAVILFQVYRSLETFTTHTNTQTNTTPTTTPTNSTSTSEKNGKSNDLPMEQIIQALRGYTPPTDISTASAGAPPVSEAALKQLEERITSSIGKVIKDEMLTQRSFAEKHDTTCTGTISHATAQGAEYQHSLPPAPSPDMSQYIRKDSIPCWGCTLP
jgi:hypothetical protein